MACKADNLHPAGCYRTNPNRNCIPNPKNTNPDRVGIRIGVSVSPNPNPNPDPVVSHSGLD